MGTLARGLAGAGLLCLLAGMGVLLLPQPRSAAEEAAVSLQDVCIVAPATPYDPASGLDPLAPRGIPANARCPVCGMYPARYPEWAAQLIYRDGAAQFFDSPLSLFLFLQSVNRFNSAYRNGDVAVSFVTDTESGGWVAAPTAWYVHGSDVPGPMRDGNLPAFARREAAEAFAAQRGGQVLGVGEIGADMLASLANGRRHEH